MLWDQVIKWKAAWKLTGQNTISSSMADFSKFTPLHRTKCPGNNKYIHNTAATVTRSYINGRHFTAQKCYVHFLTKLRFWYGVADRAFFPSLDKILNLNLLQKWSRMTIEAVHQAWADVERRYVHSTLPWRF